MLRTSISWTLAIFNCWMTIAVEWLSCKQGPSCAANKQHCCRSPVDIFRSNLHRAHMLLGRCSLPRSVGSPFQQCQHHHTVCKPPSARRSRQHHVVATCIVPYDGASATAAPDGLSRRQVLTAGTVLVGSAAQQQRHAASAFETGSALGLPDAGTGAIPRTALAEDLHVSQVMKHCVMVISVGNSDMPLVNAIHGAGHTATHRYYPPSVCRSSRAAGSSAAGTGAMLRATAPRAARLSRTLPRLQLPVSRHSTPLTTTAPQSSS